MHGTRPVLPLATATESAGGAIRRPPAYAAGDEGQRRWRTFAKRSVRESIGRAPLAIRSCASDRGRRCRTLRLSARYSGRRNTTPGTTGRDTRVPVSDPAHGRVTRLRNREESLEIRSNHYRRWCVNTSSLTTNPAEYQIVEFDQLPRGRRPGSIHTTARRAQMSCRSGRTDP